MPDHELQDGILGEVEPHEVAAIGINWVDPVLVVDEVRPDPDEDGVWFVGITSDDQPMQRLVLRGESFRYARREGHQ